MFFNDPFILAASKYLENYYEITRFDNKRKNIYNVCIFTKMFIKKNIIKRL